MVPVDYVAKAMDHIAHQPGLDGQAFHLVNPEPQAVVDMVNTFAEAAKAPQFAVPLDRRVTGVLPTSVLPRALRPGGAAAERAAHRARAARAPRDHRPARHPARGARARLLPDGRTPPAAPSGALRVRDLLPGPRGLRRARCGPTGRSTSTATPPATAASPTSSATGTVVITGASSGIGKVVALKVAQAGGIPILVARGKDKLEDTKAEIEAHGGTRVRLRLRPLRHGGHRRALRAAASEHDSIDFVVNNAGRSIRRSLALSEDRFHDFERTMQLNYFGAIRLVMGLLPTMREQQHGHVVNISSIGVQTNPPRFSAYVASKSALDSWSNVVASELVGDGVSFSTIHMPLVRTPMIAPTKIYEKFPTISPAQAADMVIAAMVDRPHEMNTAARQRRGGVRTPWRRRRRSGCCTWPTRCSRTRRPPRATPDGSETTPQQVLLAKLLKGVHW